MRRVSQEGGGTLGLLLLLLFFAVAALVGRQRFLGDAMTQLHCQQQQLQAFHLAESALAWGGRQYWHGRDGQCQWPEGEGFQACLYAALPSGRWILRGEGGVGPETLRLYRVVALRPTGEGRCYLLPEPRGWLDYPPPHRAD